MMLLTHWNIADSAHKCDFIDMYAYDCGLSDEQIEMLKTSLDVVTRFFVMAHDVAKVRNHYSARTIIEVMRHNSMLEDSDKSFKINNMIGTPLARISMEMFPSLNGFFEIRRSKFNTEK